MWLDPITHNVLRAIKGDKEWPEWLKSILEREDEIFLSSLFDTELYFYYSLPAPFVTMERDDLHLLAEDFWRSVENDKLPRTVQLNIPVDEGTFERLKKLKLEYDTRMNELITNHPESKSYFAERRKASWPKFFTGYAHSIIDPFILSEATREYPKRRNAYILDFLASRRFNLFNMIAEQRSGHQRESIRSPSFTTSYDILVQFKQLLEDYHKRFGLNFKTVFKQYLEHLKYIDYDSNEIKKADRALRAFYNHYVERERKRYQRRVQDARDYRKRQKAKRKSPKALGRSTASLGGAPEGRNRQEREKG